MLETLGAFQMVDLFLTLGAILLLGIVAKIVEGLLSGRQTKRISVTAEGQHVKSGRQP
jgi:hypothetical protein